MSKMINITAEEYLDLLRAKDKLLRVKLHNGLESLEGKSFEDSLLHLCKLNEWKFEFEANRKLLEKHEPKFCSDDIFF